MRKLYLFNNGSAFPGWNNCYSMTDDGHVLGNHICSSDRFMMHDLHDREDRLKRIKDHFKDEPYEVEVIPTDQVKDHQGLDAACKLNVELGAAANQYDEADATLELLKEKPE